MRPILKSFCLLLLFLDFIGGIKSQTVFENHNSEVYHYLYRMAQKGLIRFDDNIRPLSRNYIEQCLDSLQLNKTELSSVEKKELSFYKQEFNDRLIPAGSNVNETRFFKKDTTGRWRALSATGNGFLLRIDPVFSAATIQGTGKNVQEYSSGFTLYGYAARHWGFYFSFNDVNEKGEGIDTLRQNTPETGIVGRFYYLRFTVCSVGAGAAILVG